MLYKKKRIKLEIILSSIVLIITVVLIILIILIRINMPKKLKVYKIDDIPITNFESFDFIENKTIYEYPNDNLGITGKLILDCYTGTCSKNVLHKKRRQDCNVYLPICYDIDEFYYVPTEFIEHYCSEQCYETGNEECSCIEPYDEKGTCKRNMDDTYKEGKVCYDYNSIHFWKGKKFIILKKNIFTYLENAILKDEECPEGTKNCGIIDNNENELCINTNLNCPINYLSENKLNNDFSSVSIGDKIFYYGNDGNTTRKIIAGLVAETDLLLNKNNDDKYIIDNYTISGFLEDNQNLYKDINLGYDPYKIKDIDKKGNSYLSIFYNENIDLFLLRNKKEQQITYERINNNIIDVIHNKTKIITNCGLIALGYLLIIFICFISFQCAFYKKNEDKCSKCCYLYLIIIFIGLMITPVIFCFININKIKEAEKFYSINDYTTFKLLNIIFVILGLAFFLFLFVYIILVPIKCLFKQNEKNKNTIDHIKNSSNEQINN